MTIREKLVRAATAEFVISSGYNPTAMVRAISPDRRTQTSATESK